MPLIWTIVGQLGLWLKNPSPPDSQLALKTVALHGEAYRVVAGLRRAKREGKLLCRKRIILDREKIRTMHASGQSVRAIAAEVGVSKSLVANIVGRAESLSPKPLRTVENALLIQ